MILMIDILTGLFLGLCYDIFKAFRHKIKKTIGDILLDLFFWAFALTVCIRLFLLTGDRKFRFYELFGTAAGFCCYFSVFSGYFVTISEKTADFFLFFLKIPFTILKFFAIMIKNGVLFLLSPLIWSFRFGKRTACKGISKMKQNWKLMKRI